MTCCVKSFSVSFNNTIMSSETALKTITLDRNDYAIMFIFVNTGTANNSGDTTTADRCAFLCSNDNNHVTLVEAGGTTSVFRTSITLAMNGATVTIYGYAKTTSNSYTKSTNASGVLLAIK